LQGDEGAFVASLVDQPNVMKAMENQDNLADLNKLEPQRLAQKAKKAKRQQDLQVLVCTFPYILEPPTTL